MGLVIATFSHTKISETIDTWGWTILCRGGSLCVQGCFAASLASNIAPSTCDDSKCLQRLSNAPRGAKLPPTENHCLSLRISRWTLHGYVTLPIFLTFFFCLDCFLYQNFLPWVNENNMESVNLNGKKKYIFIFINL